MSEVHQYSVLLPKKRVTISIADMELIEKDNHIAVEMTTHGLPGFTVAMTNGLIAVSDDVPDLVINICRTVEPMIHEVIRVYMEDKLGLPSKKLKLEHLLPLYKEMVIEQLIAKKMMMEETRETI